MTSNPRGVEPTTEDRGTAMPAALFALHAHAVFAVCLANTQNYHDAEDLMQAVFVKVIAKSKELREPTRIRAWLLQVARRECVDFHRRQRRAEPLREEPPAVCPRDSGRCERLYESIQKLPENYREVIALYYLDGRNCGSVAASLGTTEAAVRQRLVRARAMLHDILQEGQP